MSDIRLVLVNSVINKAYSSIDYNIHNNIHKQHEFQKQIVLNDKSLTENEKSEAIKILTKSYDTNKILYNEGMKRICENCYQECLATLYCELCVRNYLKNNFSNWTSGNDDIDNLIQVCQMNTITPSRVTEWIPYQNLKNIKYLKKIGRSEIYTANWVDGCFIEWDSKKRELKRFGNQNVMVKRLENIESINRSWFEEVCITEIF
jgi:hypothetical protein